MVTNEQVELWRSAALKCTSNAGESERDFRIRLQLQAREGRDAKVETLRAKYTTKLSSLQERIRRAEQAVAREQSQASQARVDTAISFGGAILGAVFGRGKVGVGTVSKLLPETLQLDGFAAQGSSGSPVFDARGFVVGVIYGGATESAGRIVYAVPSARLAAQLPADARAILK